MLEKKILRLEIDFGVGDTKKAQNEINGGLKGIDAMLEKIKNKWKGIFTHSPSVNVNGLESTSRTLAEIKREYREVTKEIDRLNSKIEENESKLQSLREQEERLAAAYEEAMTKADEARQAWLDGVPGADREQMDWLEKARQIKTELDGVKKKSGELGGATQGFYNQIDKAKDKAEQLKKEMAQASSETNKMKSSGSKTSGMFDGVSKSVDRFGTRLRSIVSSAMIFNVISAGLRSVSQYLGSALSANTQFASSLASVKGNLMTAFQPIYNAVLPALTSLMNGLSKATAYAAAFVSSLFGGNYKQSQAQAKALSGKIAASKKKTSGGGGKSGKSEQEKAIDNEIKAIEKKIKALQKENKQIRKNEQAQKKLNKQNEKSAADFDNLHILEENKAEEENPDIEANENEIEALQEQLDLLNEKKQALAEMNTGGGGAGSGSNEILPDFSGDIDTTAIDTFLNDIKKMFGLNEELNGLKKAWDGLCESISDLWNKSGLKEVCALLGGALLSLGIRSLSAIFGALGGAIDIVTGYLVWFKGIFTGDFNKAVEGGQLVLRGLYKIFRSILVLFLGEEKTKALEEFCKTWATKLADWWKNDVTPWFKKEKWIELWNNVKQCFKDGWQNTCNWWKENAFTKWWINEVAPWFTSEKWIKLWNNVKQWFINGWDTTVKWWKESALVKWWSDEVSPWFASEKWIGLWNDTKQWFINGWNAITDWWKKSAISRWFDTDGEIGKWFQSSTWSGLWDDVKQWFINGWSAIVNWWNGEEGITNWWNNSVKTWFTWNKWKGIFNDLKKNFESGFKGAFNAAISIVERAINKIIEKINTLHWNIPDWVPGIGGGSFGFNFSKISIPRLAKGTVVPPNREFLAVLGDNKKETEIVSPMSTMKQAFKEALQEMGGFSQSGDTALYINGREFARAVMSDFQYELNRKGTKLVKGGAY